MQISRALAVTSKTLLFIFLAHFSDVYAWDLPLFCQENGGTYDCQKNYHYVTPFSCFAVSNQVATGSTAELCASQAVILATNFWHSAPNGCGNDGGGPEPCTFTRFPSHDIQSYQMAFGGTTGQGATQMYSVNGAYCAMPYDQNMNVYGGVNCSNIQISSYVTCPAGTTFYDLTGRTNNNIAEAQTRSFSEFDLPVVCMSSNPFPRYKQPCPLCSLPSDVYPSTGNPISYGTGFKSMFEKDYDSPELALNRIYSTVGLVGRTNIGINWQFSFERQVIPDTTTATTVVRQDGRRLIYMLTGGVWTPDADVADKLTTLSGGGWSYFDASTNATETYDSQGLLSNIVSQTGRTTTYTKDSAGRVTTITSDTGKQITLTYLTATPYVGYVTLPDGNVINYGYDVNGNLTSVTYPDGKVKTYLYGEAAYVSSAPNSGVSYVNSLTGVIDEKTNRYVAYSYDSAGRAYDEYLAPGLGLPVNQEIGHMVLSYTTDGSNNPLSTTVTNALGTVQAYNFTKVLGVIKSTGSTQPAGSGSAAATILLTYDTNGNVASRTDFNGNMTTYVYDLTRNLETSRTEGLTSAGATTTATRMITTTWHATWRLPLVITEYTGATASGTALKKTTYVYDTKANITSIKEEDPVRTLSRTTTITYTYSAVASGLVVQKVVDGPRTDISDITTYNYFDANASCAASASASTATNLGCRGQLQTITNPLSQVTTFNRYNHHGQVEQMTDPNGTVTTNTYDLRQRLLTRTISGTGITAQTTTLTYDNAGQITQLKMPDNSTLNYTYDDAHRLTQIQDTLGNKVVYTLDAAGNRTAEKTYDPSGNLAKTLTRSYDALNRLQTLTGKE